MKVFKSIVGTGDMRKWSSSIILKKHVTATFQYFEE